jgi:hypothetical protein
MAKSGLTSCTLVMAIATIEAVYADDPEAQERHVIISHSPAISA